MPPSSSTLTPDMVVAIVAAAPRELRLPKIESKDVRKIVEFGLRSGGAYAEVYVGLPWNLKGDAALGPGVTVLLFYRDAAGWKLEGGSSGPAKSNAAEDLNAAIAALETDQARDRPKPMRSAPPRAARKSSAPITEADGAGSLAETPVSGKSPRATDADVDDAERALGTRLPAGYRTFVVRLGEGVFGGKLRVYPPARVVSELNEWRDRIERYWSWGDTPLAQVEALEGVCIADTIDGDEIVFHPSDPDALFLLPRHSERARRLGRGLARAVGKIVRAKAPTLVAFDR